MYQDVVIAANPIELETKRLGQPEKISEGDIKTAPLNPLPGLAWSHPRDPHSLAGVRPLLLHLADQAEADQEVLEVRGARVAGGGTADTAALVVPGAALDDEARRAPGACGPLEHRSYQACSRVVLWPYACSSSRYAYARFSAVEPARKGPAGTRVVKGATSSPADPPGSSTTSAIRLMSRRRIGSPDRHRVAQAQGWLRGQIAGARSRARSRPGESAGPASPALPADQSGATTMATIARIRGDADAHFEATLQ